MATGKHRLTDAQQPRAGQAMGLTHFGHERLGYMVYGQITDAGRVALQSGRT